MKKFIISYRKPNFFGSKQFSVCYEKIEAMSIKDAASIFFDEFYNDTFDDMEIYEMKCGLQKRYASLKMEK